MSIDRTPFNELPIEYGDASSITSAEDLGQLVSDSGFMKAPKRTNEEVLYWDEAMVKRLFDEIKQRLHKIVTVRHGYGNERIVESRQKNVFADITRKSGDKEQKLKQFVQTIRKYSDGRGDVVSLELPKKGTSSVSDRLPVDQVVDPLEAINAAILREIGLTPDQYEIVSEPKLEISDQLSGGYPNLPVHLEITRYTIKLLGSFKDIYVKDDEPIPDGNDIVIKRHIFRWVDIPQKG